MTNKEAILKKLPAKLVSVIVIALLLLLIMITAIAVYRGQSIELWGLKIGERKTAELSKADIKPAVQKNIDVESASCKELVAKYETQILELNKALRSERNIRLSKEKRINELEHNISEKRESIHNQLMGTINSIQMKLSREENELRDLQEQYEVTAKKYYPVQGICNKGQSWYQQECKDAGELRGSLEATKLKIDSLEKSLEYNNTALKMLLEKSKEI